MYIYVAWRVPIHDIASHGNGQEHNAPRARLSSSTRPLLYISKVTSEPFDLDTEEGTFKASRLPQVNALRSDLPTPVQ
jgi:hypothetical protein